MNLVRRLPRTRTLLRYPKRYTLEMFERYDEMISDPKIMRDYETLMSGRNPRTRRPIKRGGAVFRRVRLDFYIGPEGNRWSVLFTDLEDIDRSAYFAESEKLLKELVLKNIAIETRNKLIPGVRERIRALTSWSDFVEFEGRRYGLSSRITADMRHQEDDCFGSVSLEKSESREMTINTYSCEKCGARIHVVQP